MDFRILGPIEALEGDRPLALGGAKQRALLGMLLLHANEVVSSDRLIEELWAGEGREEAGRALQVAVSRLRRALEPGRARRSDRGSAVTRAPGYVLRADPAQLDVKRFEALVTEEGRTGRAGDARPARAKLEQALALWRGPPLADLAYESFCQPEIARLEELRLGALEERIDADLALGRHAERRRQLRGLVDAEPLRERLRAQLMLALYRSGRQAEALEAYRDARRTLVEELGIEPGRELRELEQAILTQDASLDPAGGGEPATSRRPSAAGRRVRRPRVGAGRAVVGPRGRAGRPRAACASSPASPASARAGSPKRWSRSATARGARVLVGRCWEAGGAPAYWPWVQSLRAYIAERDAGGPA